LEARAITRSSFRPAVAPPTALSRLHVLDSLRGAGLHPVGPQTQAGLNSSPRRIAMEYHRISPQDCA